MTTGTEGAAGGAPAVVMLGPEPGTVSVTVYVPSSGRALWAALTSPQISARWFGRLSAPLMPGTTARLDFEDGDFFDLSVQRAIPWRTLEWRWRFLGVGPLDTVRWRIEEIESESARLTVSDTHPHRTEPEAAELGTGWNDFLGRLDLYLRTGARARYAWRAELDGGIELPMDAAHAFDPDALARWLPLRGQPLEAGAPFHVNDGTEVLTVRSVEWAGPAQVRFVVGHKEGTGVSHCRLSLRPWGAASLLEFSHTGWSELATTDEARRQLRTALARSWVTTLTRARLESGRGDGPPSSAQSTNARRRG
jgi:uncharacterized protein YndB with AHSA1/START domain